MENQLTSLMKEKYGMTRSSSVTITDKDTLYTAFRKLADTIYKNGEWTEEDEKRAVDTMIRNRNNFPLGEENIQWKTSKGIDWQADISIQSLQTADQTLLGERAEGKIGYTTIVNRTNVKEQETTTKKTYILLDPENKTGTKHATFYYFKDRESDESTYIAVGNINRAIGYDKLQRDILKEFDQQATQLPFEREDLERLLRKLSDAQYSGKKHANTFQKDIIGELTDEFLATLPRDERMEYLGQPHLAKELVETGQVDEKNQAWVDEQLSTNWGDLSTNPESTMKVNLDKAPYIFQDGNYRRLIDPRYLESYRKKNQVLTFVQSYIENTYNLILQTEYEKDIEKQTRASAWQTKKHINKETREVMEKTSLNNYFGFVELDNDVDLTLFNQFEQEMTRIHTILPKTGNTIPDLRLRKLGNHKALGMYVPGNHTIAIDFRDTSDAIEGIGIQSFVHEYGHALDYSQGNGQLLSMEKEFKEIVTRYRDNLSLYAATTYVGKKAGYYGAPTEVFARAFELYLSEAGFTSAFIKPKETYQTKTEYTLFDSDMRNQIVNYFDQHFPLIKQQIQLLQDKEAQAAVSSLKEVTVTEPIQSKSKEGGRPMTRTHKEREEAWQKANSKNILDVAESLGMGLERSGGSYTWSEHDSFVLTPKRNSFYWNSRQVGGGPIQMVQAVKECSLAQAVDYLQELDVKAFDASKEPPKPPFHYYMKEAMDLSMAEDYLMNERQLSEETIHYFVSEGLLAQSTYKDKKTGETEPVIVFKHKDPSGKIQGVALQGIVEDYNKHDRGRLKRTFGDGFIGLSVKIGNPPSFRKATEENPLKIIVFEAPIDLMSYYELHKDTIGDAVLLTMNGLRKEAVSTYLANEIAPDLPRELKAHYLEELGKHFQASEKVQIVLAVDNDPIDEKKGYRPAQHFIEEFPRSIFSVQEAVPEPPEGQEKWDWNEQLKWVKTKKMIELLEGEKNMEDKQKHLNQQIENQPSQDERNTTEQANQVISNVNYDVTFSRNHEQTQVFSESENVSNTVLNEGSKLFDQFLNDTYSLLDEAVKNNQTTLTKEEIELLLNDHFSKVEQVLSHYVEGLSSLDSTDKSQLTETKKSLLDTLQSILEACKKQLKEYLESKKLQAKTRVSDVQLSIRNAIFQKVLNANQHLQAFSNQVEERFAIKEDEKQPIKETTTQTEPKKEEPVVKKSGLEEKKKELAALKKAQKEAVESPDFLKSNQPIGKNKLTPVQQVNAYSQQIKVLEKEMQQLEQEQILSATKQKNTVENQQAKGKKEQKVNATSSQKEEVVEQNKLFRALLKARNYQAVNEQLSKETPLLLQMDSLKKHLKLIAKFPHYSQKNIQLITKQDTTVTKLASMNQWKEFGYELKENATPIYVQAPFYTIQKDEHGDPFLDKNGEIQTKKEYHFVPVFDAKQIENWKEETEKIVIEEPKTFLSVYQSLKELSPVPITFQPDTGERNSYYDEQSNQLIVREGLGSELTCRLIVNEMSKLLVEEKRGEAKTLDDESKQKFEAECLAYVVSSHLGLDGNSISSSSLSYFQTKEDGLKELTESLSFLSKEVRTLIEHIDKKIEQFAQQDAPKNKFEERLAVAKNTSPAPKKADTSKTVDYPKVESPSLTR
ncbi:LPD1 domain-containing protein [Enterococcus faecalis]|uniref:LPD1 domain-containing protein n=1 Tax=Enterococcus faecalis TaxID=1351 RepID=UPI0013E041C0|nr:LPD1 domain-containing protein [Enterococcus faecalis]